MQQKEKQAGEGGRRAEEEEPGRGGGGRDRSRGDGGRRREREERSSRAASEGGEGGEQSGRLRWRVHQLEREKLELTSSHNQEVRSKEKKKIKNCERDIIDLSELSDGQTVMETSLWHFSPDISAVHFLTCSVRPPSAAASSCCRLSLQLLFHLRCVSPLSCAGCRRS